MFNRNLIRNINIRNILHRNKSSSTNSKENGNMLNSGMIVGSSLLSTYLLYSFLNKNNSKITKISIKELSEKNNFESVKIINGNLAVIKSKNNEIYQVNIPNGEYFEKHINTDVPIYFENTTNLSNFLGPLLSLTFFGGFLYLMSKNSNGFRNIIELNKKAEIQKSVTTKFKDIVGQKNAKRSVTEFVDILNNRDKYEKLGVKVPKGALLSGPPGTGKTLLARAIAGESNLPFINMTGSDFNAMFVGVGSSKIRNLYKSANEAAEEHGGCVIFIDEIDAIGQKRNSVNTFGGNSERENTLNQLLTEMDGFDVNKNVMTFAATNRPELLDPALLRSGRFDRKILVDIPTLDDRKDLFNYYLERLNIDDKKAIDISSKASKMTPGLSGADIANIVNEAGIISVRSHKNVIDMEDISNAIDYTLLGDVKDIKLLEKERNIISYHEAGHAYLSYILPLIENPVKVSIIPREKGMLGFSQSEMTSENLTSRNKMEQLIKVLMAGRACEEVFCDDITNGASNDIEKATEIARNYFRNYGFDNSNKFMNQIDKNPYKNEVSNFINNNTDKEVIEFLNNKYAETLEMILVNKENIQKIRNNLIDKETIFYEDIKNIILEKEIFL